MVPYKKNQACRDRTASIIDVYMSIRFFARRRLQGEVSFMVGFRGKGALAGLCLLVMASSTQAWAAWRGWGHSYAYYGPAYYVPAYYFPAYYYSPVYPVCTTVVPVAAPVPFAAP